MHLGKWSHLNSWSSTWSLRWSLRTTHLCWFHRWKRSAYDTWGRRISSVISRGNTEHPSFDELSNSWWGDRSLQCACERTLEGQPGTIDWERGISFIQTLFGCHPSTAHGWLTGGTWMWWSCWLCNISRIHWCSGLQLHDLQCRHVFVAIAHVHSGSMSIDVTKQPFGDPAHVQCCISALFWVPFSQASYFFFGMLPNFTFI